MKYLIHKLDKYTHMTIYKNQTGAVNIDWRHTGGSYLAHLDPLDKIPAYTVQVVKQNMPLDSTVYGYLDNLEEPTKFTMYGSPRYAGVETPNNINLPRIEAYAAQIGLPFIRYKTYSDESDVDVLSYERLVGGNEI